MNVRRHLLISGRVQGVAYRASARDEARRRGLTGWVRNLDSGDVELVVEGPAAAVEALEAWCHRGPALAEVLRVTATSAPATGEWTGFEVTR